MHTFLDAAMAELADALDLGSSGATRTGSIPASRTKSMKIPSFVGTKINTRFMRVFNTYKLFL